MCCCTMLLRWSTKLNTQIIPFGAPHPGLFSHMKGWAGDSFLRTAVILVHVGSTIDPNSSPKKFHTSHLLSFTAIQQSSSQILPPSPTAPRRRNSTTTLMASVTSVAVLELKRPRRRAWNPSPTGKSGWSYCPSLFLKRYPKSSWLKILWTLLYYT